MPKDTTEPAEMSKADKAILKRNHACLSCRKRKMKCDALRPTCTTCAKSHAHAVRAAQHSNPGQEVPPYPTCCYEETFFFPPPQNQSAVVPPNQQAKVGELEFRISELEGLLKRGNGAEGSGVMPGGSSSGNQESRRAEGAGETEGDRPRQQPSFEQVHQQASSLGGGGESSQTDRDSSGFLNLPSSYSEPSQPSQFASSAARPPFPPSAPNDPASSSSSTWYDHSPSHPNLQLNHHPSYLPQTTNYPSSFPLRPNEDQSPVIPSSWAFLPPTSIAVEGSSTETYDPFPPTVSYPPSSGPGRATRVEQVSPPRDARLDATTSSMEEGGMDGGEFGLEHELMELLWPGWPAHLPSPGKLEHVVDTFFASVPIATALFDLNRFKMRLALPPTHKHFPHPALLHSICAVTARYLGSVELVPPQTFHPLRFAPKKNELHTLPLPSWDGFGSKPPTACPFIDEDFGEIHYRYAILYVDQGKENAGEWFPIVQSLLLLSHYTHQHARFVQNWSHLANMGRLIVPLALNAAPYESRSPGGLTRPSCRPSLLEPPKDDVERADRTNTFWLVFCQDTYTAASSGWAGVIDTQEMYLGFPMSRRPQDESISRFPTQFANDKDVFYNHPSEHATSFSLNVKATLLLRKVADFVRKADLRGDPDPRSSDEFKSLDSLITTFRASFPLELSNPLSCHSNSNEGMAIDRDLVMAHALPCTAVITLHECYTDFHDPSDPSSARMMHAARALLGQVYLIGSTNFSFGLLHPFMSYHWYLGAKTLAKALQAAMETKDQASETSLLAELKVFSHAIALLAERLPMGARQTVMLDSILADIAADPTNRNVFPGNNTGPWPTSPAASFPEATVTSFDSASSSGSNAGSSTKGAETGGPSFWSHGARASWRR